jgi:hypothetical protein
VEEKLNNFAKECNVFIDHNNKLLKIIWKTESVVDLRFRELLILFSELTQKYNSQAIFIDARLLNNPILPDTQVWHDELIVPVFVAAGVKRMAFLRPMSVNSEESHKRLFEKEDIKSKLDTRFFNSKEDAMSFLLGV